MTYRELITRLQELSDEQLDQKVATLGCERSGCMISAVWVADEECFCRKNNSGCGIRGLASPARLFGWSL